MRSVVATLDYSEAIQAAQKTAPVKVVKLARSIGLRVFAQPLGKISGKLYRDAASASGWSISVNKAEAEVRQRFTIAHELGHFILHRESVGDFVEDDSFYRSALSNRMEAEANAFAADVLMPWALINTLTQEGVTTPSELAKRLKVSEVAMSIRLGMPT